MYAERLNKIWEYIFGILYIMRNSSFLPPERHELAACLLAVFIGSWRESTQLHANKQNYTKGDDGK
jgi:hypothetical protein